MGSEDRSKDLLKAIAEMSDEDFERFLDMPILTLPGFSCWDPHLAVGALMNRDFVCGGKIDYKSPESATRAAVAMNKKTDRPGYHVLEPYPCAYCGGWHVGRQMLKAEIFKYLRENIPSGPTPSA